MSSALALILTGLLLGQSSSGPLRGVEGQVVDGDGRPVPGAAVLISTPEINRRLASLNTVARTQTDPAGRFRIEAATDPAMPTILWAWKPGQGAAWQDWSKISAREAREPDPDHRRRLHARSPGPLRQPAPRGPRHPHARARDHE